MTDFKTIAHNLGKTGMAAEKIADILETDVHIVTVWLQDAGIDPGEYKDRAYRRQMDGIAAAKARGVKFGRPKVEPPKDFNEIVQAMENKEITGKEAMQKSGMAAATFYRRLREYREKQKESVS